MDEFGNRFVKASDDGVDFGTITAEMGLKAAPIRLSLGEDSVDEDGHHHGYGLTHIDVQHGEQIRAAGFKSVRDFVEQVTKNFTTIRKGGTRGWQDTYLLELVDKHSNVLYIELSRNGEYWTINTGGIFKEKYVQKKEVVWSLPTVENGTPTDTAGVNNSHNDGGTTVSGDSPQTTSSGKGSKNSGAGKGNGEENAATGDRAIGKMVDERHIVDINALSDEDLISVARGNGDAVTIREAQEILKERGVDWEPTSSDDENGAGNDSNVRYQKVDKEKERSSERGRAQFQTATSSNDLNQSGEVRLSRSASTQTNSATKVKKLLQDAIGKVRKFINAGYHLEKPTDKPNDIVRQLAGVFSIERSKSSNSHYATFVVDGYATKIRLSTHPAVGKNMDFGEANERVSIVVYKDGEHKGGNKKRYVEYVYDPKELDVNDIVRSIVDGVHDVLQGGEFTDKLGIVEPIVYEGEEAAEMMHKVEQADRAQALDAGRKALRDVVERALTGKGWHITADERVALAGAYGRNEGGRIEYDPKTAGANTLMHEVTHSLVDAIRREKPERWEQIKAILLKDENLEDVRQFVRELYPELKDGSDEFADEVLSQYSGREGERRLLRDIEWLRSKGVGVEWAARVATWKQRVVSALRHVWYSIRDKAHWPKTLKTAEDIERYMTAEIFGRKAPQGEDDAAVLRGKVHEKSVADLKKIHEKLANGGVDDVFLQAVEKFVNKLENGRRIFERFSQEEQRGLHRGDRTHEEASIVVSRDDGTNEAESRSSNGPRERESASEDLRHGRISTDELNDIQEERLEAYAKAKGVWLGNPDDVLSAKYPIKAKGQESTVYRDGDHVIKNQDTLQSLTLQEALDEITLFNTLFPGTAKEVIGFREAVKTSAARISESARDFAEEIGGRVVEHSREDIPDEARKKFGDEVPGWYDNDTGDVHIVPENCDGADALGGDFFARRRAQTSADFLWVGRFVLLL